ncbi:MAG: WG repeat-containing protein [Clostridia bacterium]|nr:WG repeat-containing protein [Clostridia bacterium]
MMKKMLALLCAVLLLCPCAMAEETPAARYEAATLLMLAGDYAGAAEAFAALTGYMDAPQMAIYCRGLAFAEAGDHDVAVAAFTALGDFKDSAVQAAWHTGMGAWMKAEAALARGTLADLEAAQSLLATAEAAFAALPYLPDAPVRLESCRSLLAQVNVALPALRRAHEYDDVGVMHGEYIAVKRDGQWGVMRLDGELVVPCEWDDVDAIGDGMAIVSSYELDSRGRRDGICYGAVDLQGHVIVPCEMQMAYFIADWLDRFVLAVDEQGEMHLYDAHGRLVAVDTEEITYMNGEVRRVQIAPARYLQWYDQGWVLADDAGNILYVDEAVHGYYVAESGNLWLATREDTWLFGLLSADGEMLLPVAYERNTYELFRVQDYEYAVLTGPDGVTAAYAADGRMCFVSSWEDLIYTGGGRFIVDDGELYGVVDAQGQPVVPCMYDEIDTAVGGFFIAVNELEEDDLVYVLNRDGRVLLTVTGDEADAWSSCNATEEHFAWVTDGMLHIIDQQGEEVW